MLKLSAICVALLTIPSGLAIVAGEMQGTGPCGRFCGIMSSMLNILGQPTYNVVYGMLLVAAGVTFVVASLLPDGSRQ